MSKSSEDFALNMMLVFVVLLLTALMITGRTCSAVDDDRKHICESYLAASSTAQDSLDAYHKHKACRKGMHEENR